MQSHRIRLNDMEIDLVISALMARIAGLTGPRRKATQRLAVRIAERSAGNPSWIHGWLESQRQKLKET